MPRILTSLLGAALLAGPAVAENPTMHDMLALSEFVGDDLSSMMAVVNTIMPQTTRAEMARPDSALYPFEDADFFQLYLIPSNGIADVQIRCTQLGDNAMAYYQQDPNPDTGFYTNTREFGSAHFMPQATVLDCNFQFVRDGDFSPSEIQAALRDMRALPGSIHFEGDPLLSRDIDRRTFFMVVNYDGTTTGHSLKRAQLIVGPGGVSVAFRAVLSAAYLS